ncbi:MAG: hypothetical protein ACK52W_04980, partial [Alphaproteobacteria bacterium]
MNERGKDWLAIKAQGLYLPNALKQELAAIATPISGEEADAPNVSALRSTLRQAIEEHGRQGEEYYSALQGSLSSWQDNSPYLLQQATNQQMAANKLQRAVDDLAGHESRLNADLIQQLKTAMEKADIYLPQEQEYVDRVLLKRFKPEMVNRLYTATTHDYHGNEDIESARAALLDALMEFTETAFKAESCLSTQKPLAERSIATRARTLLEAADTLALHDESYGSFARDLR